MNLKESLDITRFRLKDFWIELITAILSFLLLSFVFYYFDIFTKNKEFFLLDNKYWAINSGTIKFIIWIFLFFLLKSFFRFFKRGTTYNLKIKDWPQKWIFHGLDNIQTNPTCLVIKNSASGCLLKNCLWKNFKMDFELKFFPDTRKTDRSIGILFRAINLDSYFMLEIHYNTNSNKLWIKPHVRLNGYWDAVDDIEISKNIEISDFFKVNLKVKNQIVTLFIKDSIVYEWILPTNTDRWGIKDDTNDNNSAHNAKTVPIIPFRNDYGMVGFRASWCQGAFIRDLKILSLSKFDKIILFFKS